ncbi:hypothetical protein [Yersinia proxima]|uniref:Uncharacterized protein n=1 Tax=Yersinia proxima TaxID=2890316 RepID=A0ABW9EZT1_9GAMM|nr:hypothetical protein [Yersinia proxima]CNK92368.1 Uncharacterised protein [Yersinia intermedia]
MSLTAPNLPQMKDGVISGDSLNSGDGVLISIPRYVDEQNGDFIRVRWNNRAVKEVLVGLSSGELPLLVHIPKDLAPDGINIADYSVTDLSGNLSLAPEVRVFIARDDTGTLDAPVFINKNTANVITELSVIENNGSDIYIGKNAEIVAGDEVEIIFNGSVNNQLIPESQFIVTEIVSSVTEITGITIKVPAPYIFSIGNGNATAFYRVKKANSSVVKLSHTAYVNIAVTASTLPPPVYIDINDGWLTQDVMINGIAVQVNLTDSISVNDTLTLKWDGYNQLGGHLSATVGQLQHTVTAEDISAQTIIFIIDYSIAQLINIGRIDCYYDVRNQNDSYLRSTLAIANIDNVHGILPAPIFPYAVNNIISSDSINVHNGSTIRASYAGLAIGDMVVFTLDGIDQNGNRVPEASFSATLDVTGANVIQNYIEALIPAEILLSVGNNGKIIASYRTTYMSTSGGIANSPTTEVTMNIVPSATGLSLMMTTGAAMYEPQTINVRPLNRGVLLGQPGVRVTVSVDGGALFYENNSSVYTLVLNEYGFGYFGIYSSRIGGVSVNAYEPDHPEISITKSISFGPYRVGNGKILAVNNTTGAPNNNTTPNSYYLKTEAQSGRVAITMVQVSVSGSARIIGYNGQTATILLNDDHSATVDIANSVAEAVRVSLSLPEASGSYIEENIIFLPLTTLRNEE